MHIARLVFLLHALEMRILRKIWNTQIDKKIPNFYTCWKKINTMGIKKLVLGIND